VPYRRTEAVLRNVEVFEGTAYKDARSTNGLVDLESSIDEQNLHASTSQQTGTLKAREAGTDDYYVVFVHLIGK
jgi:hypothetical protein